MLRSLKCSMRHDPTYRNTIPHTAGGFILPFCIAGSIGFSSAFGPNVGSKALTLKWVVLVSAPSLKAMRPLDKALTFNHCSSLYLPLKQYSA